jgi:TonB family protein
MSEPRFQQRDRRQSMQRLLAALTASVAIHAVLVLVTGNRELVRRTAGGVMIDARLALAKPVPGVALSKAESRQVLFADNVATLKLPPLTRRELNPKRVRPVAVEQSVERTDKSKSAVPPAVHVPLPVDPSYYATKQLDIAPKPLGDPACPNPEQAVVGRLLLLVMIDESGKVTEASIEQSGPDGTLDELCLAYYRGLRFTPGLKDGRAARSKARFELTFGPQLVQPATR